jgi:hypothetical protein
MFWLQEKRQQEKWQEVQGECAFAIVSSSMSNVTLKFLAYKNCACLHVPFHGGTWL